MRMTDLSLAIGATRPRFLTASLLPVLIGTAWGWRAAGRLDLPDLALALLATLLVHAASNVYNDISDEELGTDRANTTRIPPFTGGSRFIQDGLMDLTEMRRLANILALLAFGAGAALALRAGPGVLAFGAAGAALGFAYSLPGVRLSGLGLGEAAIGIAFGVLPVTGAAWLQAGALDADALLLSLPVSAWVAAIILANEIPDAPSDGITGKRTLAVRLGARTPLLHGLMQVAGFAALAVAAGRGLVPAWSVTLPAVLLAAGLHASWLLAGSRVQLARGIRLTLGIHAMGSLSLLAAIALPGAPPP
jgi:1,4-dihydroxy-2-naphthoate octaprenyltransferase